MKILSAEDFNSPEKEPAAPKPLKAWINKNGQLEFDRSTVTQLGLKQCKAAKFAVPDDDTRGLFLILCKEPDKDAFRIMEFLGTYYVVDTKKLWGQLGYNNDSRDTFSDKIVEFELSRQENADGNEVYRMQELKKE